MFYLTWKVSESLVVMPNNVIVSIFYYPYKTKIKIIRRLIFITCSYTITYSPIFTLFKGIKN